MDPVAVAQWIEHHLRTKRLLVQFRSGYMLGLWGLVPNWGHAKGTQWMLFSHMFLSFSFSLPSPLSKNK